MSGDGAYASADGGRSGTRKRADDGPASIVIFVICVGAILYLAWSRRNDGVINPEAGLGYALGIVGGSLMLALLFYPLRKRMKSMRTWGSVGAWFRLHMILGVVGPVLVIIHSNFETQSLNAAVALYSMLIVSASGVVGRYIYGRIHRGLYGGKLEAKELIAEAQGFREGLGMSVHAAAWKQDLATLEREALGHAEGFFDALGRASSLNKHAARSERTLLEDFTHELEGRAHREGWPQRKIREELSAGRARVRSYHAAIRKVGGLAIYDRLFAAWHVLHLPLFFMLILTALIHVVAVHLY